MRYIYSLLFYLAIPFILIRLLWRSRQNPQYRQRLAERFAFFHADRRWQNGLWIHAVSLGEVVAATPLIKAIQKQYPHLPLTITTMTITGSERVRATFGEQVFHVYVPYDAPIFVRRFLNKIKPKALMVLETELWPNILAICKRRKISILISNARLSERSANGYRRIPTTTRQMLSAITELAAHAQIDAERFINLGMDPARVTVAGSIKFDASVPPSIYEQADVLRGMMGRQRRIWIAASTHEGEETKILAAFSEVIKTVPDALLVLVPRHPERFDKVAELAKQQGYHIVRRTSHEPCSLMTQVFIGDTMGELKLFYAASDVAFVGGSLVPIGGHNILEPASLGTPTLTGPHMFNFEEVTELLLQANALIQVRDELDLAHTVIRLLQNSMLRAELSDNEQQVLERNRGALVKNLELLTRMLDAKAVEC